MPVGKITRSQLVALCLLPIVLVILGVLCVIVVLLQGRPFLYASERMRDADTSFRLLKIRTMAPSTGGGETVLGGHQKSRISSVGRFLRCTRLDELPQIFNVIRGDIGFIGPRPPLRRHVQACPDRYRQILQVTRPGITGLATVVVHRREERLLSRGQTEAETEELYVRHCLPIKLRLDLLYSQKRSAMLDLMILWRTVARLSARPYVAPEATCAPDRAEAETEVVELPLAA